MIYIVDFLSVVGAIGLFLYGMKLMSESLQKITGNKLRSILNFIAASKIKAVFSGLVITALVQASAVVSVMAVEFCKCRDAFSIRINWHYFRGKYWHYH